MNVKHGDGKSEFGPGVSIELTGSEVAIIYVDQAVLSLKMDRRYLAKGNFIKRNLDRQSFPLEISN